MTRTDRFTRWLGGKIDAFRAAEGPPPDQLWPFLRWAMAGAWPMLWVAGIASAVTGTFEVIGPLLLGLIIDGALATGPADFWTTGNIVLIVLSVLFFLGVRPLFLGINAATNAILVQPNIQPLVLQRLNRWTLGQSIPFFENDFAGRIAQKQMQTARAVTDIASETINTGFFALASVIGALLMLMSVSGWIALALVVWMAGYLALIRYFMPRIRARSKARANARTMVTGQVVDTITNITTVKLFAHAEREDRAALMAMEGFRDKALDFGAVSTAFRFWLMAVAGALPVLLIGGTLILWTQGSASAGEIAAAGAIAIRLAQMTGWVSFTLMGIYANIGEVEDGMHTLAPAMRLVDDRDSRALQVTAGEIRFDNVAFTHGGTSAAIRGLSLTIRPGEKLAIVGASGAGKSTLVSLLMRLYDVENGAITIDGQDLRAVTQDSLRRQIGMVTQDTAMFNRSARENILYGNPDADESAMLRAADKAEALQFIRDLRDFKGRTGFDAFLGERGVKLSGGQRQRIAIARAILKDAPILILDEATSALDSEVEAAIQSALNAAMEGKTVLAIAHRLSTVVHMDRIIVLDQGRIVEEGTHDSLLAQNGIYAGYWARQSGGFDRKAAE
ncbi:MAG: ATP-binding cassette, subfamily B, bacterial [Rhodobacteraceae bacterium HLUCCA08]|nr:MAG: ATP-binding cassette, subfamily B, bacterial [Rhodobacteraceae bacterium HLUCCA08]